MSVSRSQGSNQLSRTNDPKLTKFFLSRNEKPDTRNEYRALAPSPTFSTRGENRLFFGRNRPPRRLNKGTVCQK